MRWYYWYGSWYTWQTLRRADGREDKMCMCCKKVTHWMKWEGSLDHAALKSAALGAIGIFVSAYWTPHGRYLDICQGYIRLRTYIYDKTNEMVFGCFTMSNQTMNIDWNRFEGNHIIERQPTLHWLHWPELLALPSPLANADCAPTPDAT